MSPIISEESRSQWVTYTVKVPKDLDELIQGYIEARGLEENRSFALRELISRGLQDPRAISATLQANADSRALARLVDALDEVLIKFRESSV